MPDVTVTPEQHAEASVTVIPESADAVVVSDVAAAQVQVSRPVHASAVIPSHVHAQIASLGLPIAADAQVQGPIGHALVEVDIGPRGPQGPPGPEGPPGPPGQGEGGVWAYRHVQDVAAAVWTFTHPLSFRPTVTVVANVQGMGLEQVITDVLWLSADTVQITLQNSMSGEVYLT